MCCRVLNRWMALGITLLCGCTFTTPAARIRVENPGPDAMREVPVVVAWTPELESAWAGGCRRLWGGREVVYQRDDLDGDGQVDELVFLADLEAGQSKDFVFVGGEPSEPEIEPRAHAGMYLRGLVGPAWESDRVAYRIYWNADTAIDIFCKTEPILSLEAYASPELNYHVQSRYGLDVLKVGRSLGVGGFGVWLDGKVWKISDTLRTYHVRADGPLRAVLEVEFVDWYTGPGVKKPGETGPGIQRRLDLKAWLSVIAGQTWGEARLFIKPVDEGPVPEIVTGVVKHERTERVFVEPCGILGRWGRQALGDHEVPESEDLGLAVMVSARDVLAYGEDDLNSYVRLRAVEGRVSYRYHGSWAREPGGARSAADYERMLRDVVGQAPQVQIVSDTTDGAAR